MEIGGISIFDLVVICVVGLAALIGLMTGFIRGGLFLGSWILAIITALYAYPFVLPLTEGFVEPGWKAMAAAAAGTFLVSLVILLLLTHFIAKLIRSSRLNMLDRSLGMLAGGGLAIAVLSILYLPIGANFSDEAFPDWIENAKTRPIIERVAVALIYLIPENFRPNPPGSRDDLVDSATQLDRLTAAPPIAGSGGNAEAGYTEATLEQLQQEIENQQ